MRKMTPLNRSQYFSVLFLMLFAGVFHSYSQCPTVAEPLQSFCNIPTPLISDLVAIDNGGGIQWYSTLTSTSPISISAPLVNGKTYYAGDTTGVCVTRNPVTVDILGPPIGLNFQGVCVDDPNDATISDLLAVGNDVKWYRTPIGGIALSPSTVLADNTIYYADQANPITGCRTSRLSVFVNVGVVPVSTGSSIQQFCDDPLFPPTIADLVTSGNNNWYATSTSAIPLDPTTPLVDGESYFASTVDSPCESIERFEVLVLLIPFNDSGENGSIDICETDVTPNQTVDLFSALGGTPDNNGIWTGPISTTNGNLGTVDVTGMTVLDSPYVFTYTVSSSTLCDPSSSTVTVFVVEGPDAGLNGTLELCENDDPVDLFTILNGTPDIGGSWTPLLSSGTSIFDPSLDAPGIYTYTVAGTLPCGDQSANVTVTVPSLPDAGLDGTLDLCSSDNSVDLFTVLGGTPDAGGTWSPALSSGTGVFDPSLDPTGVYTYTVIGTSPCGDDSATVTVTLVPAPDAGLGGTLDLCSNDTPVDLFTILGGTPDAGGTWSPSLSSGTGVFDPNIDAAGTYTYTVTAASPCGNDSANITVSISPAPDAGLDGTLDLCSSENSVDLFTVLGGTPDIGGTWSPALSSGTGVFDPSLDPTGVYTYTVTGTAPCGDDSATVAVTLVPAPDAGVDGTLDLCSNDTPIDLFTVLGGTPDVGGIWSPSLSSGTGVFDPNIDAAGTYTYTVTAASPCGNDSANITVSISPAPDAGLDGTLDLCSSDNSVDLFTVLGGTPDVGGTWSPALSSGTGVFDANLDPAGVYTYTVTGTAPCGDDSATVTITLILAPNAGVDGTLDLCSNDTPVDLFTILGGTPDAGGTWSPSLSSGTGVFDPNVDSAGTYTYTVTAASPCGNDSANITVSISPAPDAGVDSTLDLCSSDNSVDLFTILGGTPDVGGTWSPLLSSGTGVFDPNLDPAGVYTYTVTGTAPCGDSSATVTVTLVPTPDAGVDGTLDLCSNDTPVDLFTILGGTPDAGGTWSPALSSGTGVFDPNLDAAGIYTYTVTGTSPCGNDTANIALTITQAPNAGLDGTINLCEDGSSIDLFTILGGMPDAGGTWSPALSSGTGVFDPNLDPAGVYTYTVTGTAPCGDSSATVTVTLVPAPDAGLDGTLDLCSNDTPVDLFTVLGGTPDVGGTWSPTLSSGTGVFNPNIDAAGTYTYTVTGTSPCGNDSANITVTITPAPDAGLDGTVNLCEDDTPVDLFAILGGTPDIGGTWSPALSSGTGVFDPNLDLAGVYTYTVTGTAPCGDGSATVTVTLVPAPDAGVDGTLDLCSNDTPVDLFTVLGGTPDTGGTWSPMLSSGTGIFDPNIDTAGTYIYTVTGTSPCGNDSANITVTITPAPDAGLDGTVNLCEDDTPVDLFAILGGTPNVGGTWSPALSSGTGVFDPTLDAPGVYVYTVTGISPCGGNDSSSVSVSITSVPDTTGAVMTATNLICLNSSNVVEITGAVFLSDGLYTLNYQLTGANSSVDSVDVTFLNGNTIFTLPASQLSNIGLTTLTITDLFIVGNICAANVASIAPIQFLIETAATPELISGGNIFCIADNPTISDLTANIIEPISIVWYDSASNGNPYSETSLLVDGETYFASTSTVNGCESEIRLEVTISIIDCNPQVVIPDGFSPNGDGINDTFNVKNLTEQYPNYTLEIYNRYGNVLYKGNKDRPNWDGTSDAGSQLPVGVYFYILNFSQDGKDSVQGRVYLSR